MTPDIEDHALIGDMRGCALVAKDACIDWMCFERFDADPVFLGLLDAGVGGGCQLRLQGGITGASRRYLPETNVLETTLSGATGTVVVTDWFHVRQVADAGDTGPDSEADGRLLRHVQGVSGRVALSVRVEPAFDWGRRHCEPLTSAGSARWVGHDFQACSSHAWVADGSAATTSAVLTADDTLVVILGHGIPVAARELGEVALSRSETVAYWREWAARSTYAGTYAEAVMRSALCLKALTYAPTGAMVAAPTTGLPEAIGGVRNWDYRYVWTRDASFVVTAFLNIGYRREAAEFLRFLHGACHGGEAVRIMYAVEGDLPETRELNHLAGWRGSKPVTLGNGASEQRQNEIFGELLAALNLYVEIHGTAGLCPDLRADLAGFVDRLAGAAIERWRLPDQGIWELPGRPRHLLHSKVMCWVALDRAIQLAPHIDMTIDPAWTTTRQAIRTTCLDEGWNERLQAYAMEFGSGDLDMSTLRLALMDFLPADDPRMAATLTATVRDLAVGDGLYRRYRFDDDLPGEEGAFLTCSFWALGITSRRGDLDTARRAFDRVLMRANDVGLFGEEIDAVSGAFLGNFPQGLTHMALIHEAVFIADTEPAA